MEQKQNYKGCVFILEDNQINLKLIKDLLEYNSYELMISTDGLDGLNKIKKNHNKIDLALIDLQLPTMGGLEVIKNLKKDEKTKEIPIIVVSAHAMESDIKVSKDAGCYDYITKPINIKEFLSKVEMAVGLKS